MKRIVFINPGTNKLMTDLVNELAKKHEVYYVSAQMNSENLSDLVRCVKVRSVRFGTTLLNVKWGMEIPVPSYYKKLGLVLKSIEPDIIVANGLYRLYFWQALHYTKKHSNKLFLYTELKAYPESKIKTVMTKLLLQAFNHYSKYVTKVLTFTEQGKMFLQNKVKASIEVCPAGIDTKIFKEKKNKVFLKDGILRILMVARMVPFKEYFTLLNACKILKDEGIKFLLIIRGEGILKKQILKRIELLGLWDNVEFRQKIPYEQMPGLYHESDVVVLPSRNEAIGMVVPQAMGCGIPTITSDSVGANTYVKSSESGFIYKTRDIFALYQRLNIINDKLLLKLLGHESSGIIHKYFTIKECSKQLEKALLEETK